MHPFSTPENTRKPYVFLMFSGGRERTYWKRMGQCANFRNVHSAYNRYE